jgi:hypothetical protein
MAPRAPPGHNRVPSPRAGWGGFRWPPEPAGQAHDRPAIRLRFGRPVGPWRAVPLAASCAGVRRHNGIRCAGSHSARKRRRPVGAGWGEDGARDSRPGRRLRACRSGGPPTRIARAGPGVAGAGSHAPRAGTRGWAHSSGGSRPAVPIRRGTGACMDAGERNSRAPPGPARMTGVRPRHDSRHVRASTPGGLPGRNPPEIACSLLEARI